MAVQVGQKAPDFTLTAQSGEAISLGSFAGKKAVIVYFYPKDETPGCTAESCAFRDSYEVFKEAGAEVIGISGDSVRSHKSFAANHRLPFILLSDEGNKVRKLFGVPSTLGILPGRVTYVLDQEGVVRHMFSSQLNFQGHVDEALKVIKQLQKT
jgi:thioredoxin-dependent peroxiredoxin